MTEVVLDVDKHERAPGRIVAEPDFHRRLLLTMAVEP